LDGLEPQGTMEVVKRSQKCEVKSTGPLDQAVAKKAKNPAVSFSPGTRFLFFSFSLGIGHEPITASRFIQNPLVTEGKEVNVAWKST